LIVLLFGSCALGQNPANPSPQVGPGNRLFVQLATIGLDATRVYRARDVSIDRGFFHITLDDGTIAFTSDINGRPTGAFFQGEGEILLTPPDQVERGTMALFTKEAILEERFSSAYLRFNDDTFAQLQPSLRPPEDATDFVPKWNSTATDLAQQDALRLLVTFSQFLPPSADASATSTDDRFLHVRMQGETKGTFDVYFDSNAPEQVWAGQLNVVEEGTFYDVWTASSPLKKIRATETGDSIGAEEGRNNSIEISDCKIRATIQPPTSLDAEATLQLLVRRGGQRTLLFELARTLVIKELQADGHPVEFIHNPTLEGTQLARRGNDLVAIILPQPTQPNQRLQLRFVYSGDVLSEAGPGLLYVGARGTWYPNRGLALSNFDLEFRYPASWTLVATGKRSEPGAPAPPNEQVSRWVSERPIPLAGFNLGKYQHAEAHAGPVIVDAYGTKALERGFPQPEANVIQQPTLPAGATPSPFEIAAATPSPAHNVQMVAETSANAVETYSRLFGPYPYSSLALTQMPGNMSQGWPSLIFLSSLSFLTPEEKAALHIGPVDRSLINLVIAHETAHQWWGDLVLWNNYRDQWISEALADYSALMIEEGHDSLQFHAVLTRYRNNLMKQDKNGVPLMTDGPVTLGSRLNCSKFPGGYEAISYGRGVWLMHMLRYMLRDAERTGSSASTAASPDEPFIRALRRVRDRYAGKPITTREFFHVFEEDLPRSLWYEGHKSLDWFYDGWVNGTAVPRFELHNLKYADKPGATSVSGVILQKDAPPDLVTPVPVYAVHGTHNIFLGRVLADGPETTFHLTAPADTHKLVLDPNQTLLSRNH